MPFTLVDCLGKDETDWHNIYDVKGNDTVLIAIQPEGDDYYTSYVYDPDLDSASFDSGFGGHNHQFIAEKAGDYLLKLYSDYPDVGNYTVKSSHRLTLDNITPDFSVACSPGTLEVEKGSSADAIVMVYSENGFDAPVLLSVTGEPSGVTGSLDPTNVTPPKDGQANSTLSVQVDISAIGGVYILNVTGESDTLSHWCEITLIIEEMGAYLEIRLSKSVIVYQSAVNVSGSISPSIADAEIHLECRLDGSQWSILKNVTTSIDGKFFCLNWKPATAGFYEIRAHWGGNEEFDEVRSQIKNLRVDKSPSSVSCSIDSSRITYGGNVTISANLDVPLSTGLVILQWTSNNVSWNDLISHAPSEGKYTHHWAPDAGLYFIRAKWTGDNNYLPSSSTSRTLNVEKRSTELTTELSANIINSSDYVTITVSISPVLTEESITIQVAKNGDDWQNLTSNVTDSLGSFTHTWFPENYGQFHIISTWTGTRNYEGNVSKPVLLIVEKGFPTIPTQITDISVPSNIELRDNMYISYNVIIEGTQKVIHSGNESLDTSHVGTFDFYIIYIGNETHKSTFYIEKYTINKIKTEIEIIDAPESVEQYHSAYVKYSVYEKKSGKIVHNDSQKLDTSTIGPAYVTISYAGNETHTPASKPHNYEVKEPFDPIIIIEIIGVLVAVVGIITPLLIKRRSKGKTKETTTTVERPQKGVNHEEKT